MEAWDHDVGDPDEKIDEFNLPISASLSSFNDSNSITQEGTLGIAKLTLSYGNLTTNLISCPHAVQPSSTSDLYIPRGKFNQ